MKEKKHTIVFTGGGTGGHVYPGLALITPLVDKLQKKSQGSLSRKDIISSFLWIGSYKGPEHYFVSQLEISFKAISTGKLRRYFSWENFTDPFKIIRGYFQSLMLFKNLAPKLVVSIGGFASVPVVLAAATLGIPIVSVVCDLSLGLATKINSLFSHLVLCAYLESKEQLIHSKKHKWTFIRRKKRFNKVYTSKVNNKALDTLKVNPYNSMNDWIQVVGNPIRKEVYSGDAALTNKKLGIDAQNTLVLFLGGSIGASQINQIVLRLLPYFSKNMIILHQTGIKDSTNIANPEGSLLTSEEHKCKYVAVDFLTDDYANVLARADVVISRAGAGTLWELIANAIPSAVIPFTRGSRGDQIENTHYFSSKNIIADLGSNPTDEEVLNTIILLCNNLELRNKYIDACKEFGAKNTAERAVEFINIFC